MLLVLETKKVTTSKYMADTTDLTRDGELSILTNLPRKDLKDSTTNLDSTLTDHSTSDLECQ
jgi:hypothetical protein